ncbi:MAG: hypothetical protein EBU88_03400 [Acidobacteria bacterium]|nr:hypothetical protein [Acidobacteriota bacterium]
MNISTFLSIVVLIGLLAIVWKLFTTNQLFNSGEMASPIKGAPLADDSGPRLASRRLRYAQWLFGLLLIMAFVFHLYWALFAAGPFRVDPPYAATKDRFDNRNRRESESVLRGWIFDRHHDVNRTLARYKYLNGGVIRDYQLGLAASHLTGYGTFVRGDAALEKALSTPSSSYLERPLTTRLLAIIREPELPEVGPDLVTTIDYDLQREAFELLRSRRAAVAVIDPRDGQILALASSPGFDPVHAETIETWKALQSDEQDKPLLNRATSEYYLPGSTFKTVTAAAAIESRLDNRVFTCRREGWITPDASRPIRDDEGEAHGEIDLAEAFVKSCNQYFAHLGVELGRLRMGEEAERFGLRQFPNPSRSLRAGRQNSLWNTENRAISSLLAPASSTFVAGRELSSYDLALESIGQGFVQVTPLQMALVAAAVANGQGIAMRPTIEMGLQPVPLSQAMTPATAARLRQLMAQVVRRGTASRTLSPILDGLVTAGGKTGTAQRLVTVYDPRTGQPVMVRDEKGRQLVQRRVRIDSWFIGFAPVDDPQIAFAVVVEDGGYGAATSAPIAGHLIRRALRTGLIR